MQTVLEQADGAKDQQAAPLAEKLLHLYRGRFLADEDAEWFLNYAIACAASSPAASARWSKAWRRKASRRP